MTTKRKTVERLRSRPVKWGEAVLLRITYVDGTVSHGVSIPGMLATFGGSGLPASLRAARYFSRVVVY